MRIGYLVGAQLGDFEEPPPDGGWNETLHLFSALVAEETADSARVRREVRAAIAARQTAVARRDGFSDVEDGALLALALRAHVITQPEADALISGWCRDASFLGEQANGYQRILRVSSSTTPDEARAALAALPEKLLHESAIEVALNATRKGLLGHVMLLAGEIDAGIPWLERAAHVCFTRSGDPFVVQHARLELAQALEQKNDVEGACKEYDRIVAQWGHARPRSLTAERAKARLTALHCAR
jgi:hypothetical protein